MSLKRLSLALLATALLAAPAAAADPKPVTIAVGTSVLNVGYPMLTLPITLGYWKAEGYDVKVEPVGASLQAIQQMVAGNAQFAQVNASVILQSNTKNNLPVRFVMENGVIDWSIATLDGAGLSKASDFKGKTIGVFSLATGGIPLMKSWLATNGVDPEKDVTLIPLGLGAAPVQALKSGQVDALLYWASATAGFENAGLKLNKIVPEGWRSYPDYSLSTMQKTAETDPDMVVAIARGVAMATVYALANPECAVKLHWEHYPETKPKGADEATLLAWDLNNINAQLQSLSDGFALNGGKEWGATDPAGVARLQSFLRSAGLVPSEMAPEEMIVKIPNFLKRVNDFDADAIRADAKACKVTG
ncbi:ABC transporter substrate-binding protein [Segnochrobactraceae bacterium EtOH-i3]